MKSRNAPRILVALLPVIAVAALVHAGEWPQWRGPGRDGTWTTSGLVETLAAPRLALRWSVPISSGYSGPTVANGRVYVTDRVTDPEEAERVLCFEWQTGKRLWSHSYAAKYGEIEYRAGPRAAVIIDDGLAYSLGALGHLYCFDAASGSVRWNHDLKTAYRIRMPIWGIAASPLVEGDLLIVQIGGTEACLVAFEKKSGKERWKALADKASYSSPIVIDQAGKRVLVAWTGDQVAGLDATTGALLWHHATPAEKWPIACADPVFYENRILLSEAHRGSLLLRVAEDRLAVEELWHRRGEDGNTDGALHCLQSTPLIRDGLIYGVDSEGVLRCLDLETGNPRWKDETSVPKNRWATMHLVQNGERTWMLNDRGELLLGRLSGEGLREVSRAQLLAPTTEQLRRRDGVTWSHPAFAYRHVFARNDEQLVCADLSAP